MRAISRTFVEANNTVLRWMVVGVIATIFATFAVTSSPRGSQVWIMLISTCWIEVLVGGFIVWRREAERAVQAATFAVLFSLLGTYACVLLATVATYSLFFPSSGKSDEVIAALTILESLAFLLVVSLLTASDDVSQMEIANHELTNHVRVNQGNLVANAINGIKIVTFEDAKLQVRREMIVKRLYAVQVALIHSHTTHDDTTADADIQALSDALASHAASIRSTASSESWQELERLTGSLENTLRLHRIS